MTFKSFQNKSKLFSINSNTTEHQNSLQIETFHQYSSNNKKPQLQNSKPEMLKLSFFKNMIHFQAKLKSIHNNLKIEQR